MERFRSMLAGGGGMGMGAAPGTVSISMLLQSLPGCACVYSQRVCSQFLTSAASQDNTSLIDNSETVYISSLALLKMLRHGRAGVPMEVMGLMLGEFVDDFTVRVVDVFAMPQSGTGVSVEAVDPVFQMKMMDMLRQTGRYVRAPSEPPSHS
jgi:26S proteasome regulatory subunit N11